MTVSEVLSGLHERLNPQALERLDAVIALELTGEHGGHWTIDARKDSGAGLLAGHPGAHGLFPNLRARISADDFLRIAQGKLKPQLAVMTGKLSLKGDLSYAFKLAEVLT